MRAWRRLPLRRRAESGAIASTRRTRFALVVSVALTVLVLGGDFFWSAPAEAQTEPVLVKNTGQTSTGDASLTSSVVPKRSQRFTTGPNPNGYRLSHVGIGLEVADTSTAGADLQVRLHAAGSGTAPGDELCTLTDPPAFKSSGVHYFSVPPDSTGCSTLARDTTYEIVIDRVSGTSGNLSVQVTNTDTEDTGAETGFAIADASGQFAVGFSVPWTQTPHELHIEVAGRAVPTPVLVKNTGQTSTGDASLTSSVVPKRSQRFTTGPNPNGYRLSHVGIGLEVADTSTAGADLQVKLHAAGSGTAPGDELCTLTDPPAFKSSGVHYFSVPPDSTGCSTLISDTTYDVVVERLSGTSGNLSVLVTDTDAEDAGAETGFTIADASGQFTFTWTQTHELHIEVAGRAVPTPVLVKNTGQTSTGDASLTSSVVPKRSQRFTTGPNPNGYRLSHVGIGLEVADTSTAGADLQVRLHAAGSGTAPGDELCTLTDPPAFKSSGVHYFSVPPDSTGCSTLISDTTYDVVVERLSGTSGNLSVQVTNTDTEDTGAETGFAIADASGQFAVGFSVPWTQTPHELHIEVAGRAIPTPVLVKNTGQASTGDSGLSAAATAKRSQRFTTGPNPNGYRLGHVGIGLNVADTSKAGADLEVRLHAAGSGTVPGDELCTLTDPPAFKSSGVHYFSVPPDSTGCSTLARDTTYEIVIDRVSGTSGNLSVQVTNTDTEDTGAETGFAIADASGQFAVGFSVPWTQTPHELHIEVAGRAIPTPVLVKNTGQASTGDSGLSAAATAKRSQRFTTGPNPNGYRLGHVGIGLNVADTSKAGADLEVRLHAAGSGTVPGDELCTLVDPPAFKSSGVHYFSVPPDSTGCSTLASDTTYEIVIDRVSGTSGNLSVQVTNTDTEDTGAETGFAIADASGQFAVGFSVPWTQTPHELHIEVIGSIAATGVPVITGIPEVFGTLTADTSGIDDEDGLADVSFSYQWIRVQGTTEIEVGADSSTYFLAVADIGALIKVEVTFTDDVGSEETVISEPVGPVTNPAGLSPSQSTLSVVEGSSATYTLVLDAEPSGSVIVDVSGGGDVTVEPVSLTFTAADWDMAQSVTVSAAEDVDTVNDTQTVTHAVAEDSAVEYVGLVVGSVVVTVNDNDTAGVSVSRQSLVVAEGATGSYMVRLAFEPTDSVIVDVFGGGDVTVDPVSLTFTAETWEMVQSVTVRAAEDLDAVDDIETVIHAVTSDSAVEYVGLGVDSVAVTVVDDDDPAVTVSFEQGSLSVAEGVSVRVRVRLSAVPERTVVVPLTATLLGGVSSSDYSGVPASVRFGSGDTVASFVFSAAVDRVEDAGESVRLGFGALPVRVTAGATSEAVVSITDVAPPNRAPVVSAVAEPDRVWGGGGGGNGYAERQRQ